MDHLRVMPGARRADVRVAVRRGERLEDRLAGGERLFRGADHETVAVLQAPHTAARATVDEPDAMLAELLASPDRLVEVRVATVDDDVALREARSELGERVVDRLAGGDHDPDDAWRPELGAQIREIVRRRRAH